VGPLLQILETAWLANRLQLDPAWMAAASPSLLGGITENN